MLGPSPWCNALRVGRIRLVIRSERFTQLQQTVDLLHSFYGR
jgi:hypothetical protein